MLHGTPPSLPHGCVHSRTAVVMGGVMETVVSGAMCSGGPDTLLRVCVLIGKEQKNERVTAAAEQLISQRKDCLNLAPCSASPVTPRRPVRNGETGFLLCQAVLRSQLQLRKKGLFHMKYQTSQRGWNALFNLSVDLRKVAKMRSGLFHQAGSSGTSWPSGPGAFTCRAPRHVRVIENQLLVLNVSLNIG